MSLKKILYSCLSIENFFDKIVEEIIKTSTPLLFKGFCQLYLAQSLEKEYGKKKVKVWMMKQIPEKVLNQLGLSREEEGIDMIIQTQTLEGIQYSAVQCTFKTSVLPLDSNLSTFYDLCAKTQETARWDKHIIITNAKRVGYPQGVKTKKKVSICYSTFLKLTRIDILTMLGKEEGIVDLTKDLPMEELRERKIQYYSNLINNY